MPVSFVTSTPKALLDKFDARIVQTTLKGKIVTWVKDADGDYTHTSANWNKKAWFRPKIEAGRLTFDVIKPKGTSPLDSVVYSYYHGHLIQTFLEHFPQDFSLAEATPQT